MANGNDLNQTILNKIKERHLAPTPRWFFIIKDYAVWVVGALALLVGGLAFSVIIYMFSFNDWQVYRHMNRNFLQFVLLTLPYFWIILLLIFIAIVNYEIKHTKKGYRYSWTAILVASIVTSLVLGVIFFGAGMSEAIDDVLGRSAPFYQYIINHPIRAWDDPGHGRLAGVVVGTSTDDIFILFSTNRQEWEIDASGARVAPMVEIRIGNPLKMIGQIISTNSFQAEQILPAGPGRQFLERSRSFYPLFPDHPRPECDLQQPGFCPVPNN